VHWLMDGIDRIPKNLIKQEHVKMFSAIRYVNNCLKHNATFKEAHKIEGLDYPFDYPFDYGAHYIWVPTENIEISEKNKKQKENYDAELKWKNVYKTLSDILKVVEEYYSEF